MTAANWIALILPIFGFIFGSILYVLQKSIDRSNEEQREKRELYRRASVALQRVQNGLFGQVNDLKEIEQAVWLLEEVLAEIYVAAPDEVVDAWQPIPEHVLSLVAEIGKPDAEYDGDKAQLKFDELPQMKSVVLASMRKDTFGKTLVTADKIKALLTAFGEMYNVTSNPVGTIVKALIK